MNSEFETNKQEPLISILVPVYNCEPYLDQCISSIINQDYKNLQIVLVNDGSTDKSLEICRKYAEQDKRISVLTGPNKGVASTRNLLLDQIKSEYFLFIDADDWIEPNTVSYLLTLVQENKADIAVCSNVREELIKTENPKKNLPPKSKVWGKNTTIEKFLFHKELSGSLWNKLISSRLLHKEPDSSHFAKRFNPEIYYGEDALFCWDLIQNLNKLIISDKQLYHYRMNETSLSHSSFGKKKLTAGKVWEKITKDTQIIFPQFEEIAKARWGMEMNQLLFLAAKENYKKNEEIIRLQKIVKQNLPAMNKVKITSIKGLFFAWLVSHNYNLAKIMTRGL